MEKIVENLNKLRSNCASYSDGVSPNGADAVMIVECLEILYGEFERLRQSLRIRNASIKAPINRQAGKQGGG